MVETSESRKNDGGVLMDHSERNFAGMNDRGHTEGNNGNTTTTQAVVLLLSGWAGSGKDEVANLLMDEFNFQRLAFADGLKRDCAQFTGIPLSVFHSYEKDQLLPYKVHRYPDAKTPRDVLIRHARNVRIMDPFAYSRVVVQQIADGIAEGRRRFVISDWRYPLEYEYVSSFFTGSPVAFVRCRIYRPSVTPSAEESEHMLDTAEMDLHIPNPAGIAALRYTVRDSIRNILHIGRQSTAEILFHPG
jgi:hypothetical protein